MKFGNVPVRRSQTGRTIAFFAATPSVAITGDVISGMVRWSKEHGNCDMRICLHHSPLDQFQEMIILHHRDIYRQPHREARQESYHIIKGTMAVYTFEENGSVKGQIILDGKQTIMYRMDAFTWHVTVPLTPIVIFHESKLGPFRGDETTFAPWAPADKSEGRGPSKR